MMRLIPLRVLVIDDDQAVCRKTSAWLQGKGCDVVTFTDPAEGIQHATRAPAQMALVDLRLADADGIEVIAALRRVAPQMRIIALSAFPDARQAIAAMRAGARDLLEKPLQEEPLWTALDRQLADTGLGIRSEEEFNRRLGARIRAVRTDVQLTLAAVADTCGLTAAQLSQIELGKTATTTWSLARICSALGTPLVRLFSNL